METAASASIGLWMKEGKTAEEISMELDDMDEIRSRVETFEEMRSHFKEDPVMLWMGSPSLKPSSCSIL
jgi:hypothetical protein